MSAAHPNPVDPRPFARPFGRPAARHLARPRWRLTLLAMLIGTGMLAGPARARCLDEDGTEPRSAPPAPAPGAAPGADAGIGTGGTGTSASEPRLGLQAMVREAIKRSQALGAARLLAEAAAADVDEVRGGAMPQASVSGTGGLGQVKGHNIVDTKGAQVRASFNVSTLLFDGGRNAQLTGWRRNLAEAAQQGQLSAQDQIALQTVSLAVDRSRYRLQAQVYQQYARKMSCLVDALQTIVNADKGRASELVQAKKTQQQAELAQAQSLSALKQIESRLARFIGDALPGGEGTASLLLDVPPLDRMMAEAERAADSVQLQAQEKAADSYARAVAAAQKPQLSLMLSGTAAVGNGNSTNVVTGLAFNVPLLAPGSDAATLAAAKRAEAARLQRLDALEARKYRMAEVYEQAVSAFDRAKQTVEVVRNSDRVRNYTLQQWQQLGRRSLFDVMSAESEHYNLRIGYVNALHDGQQATALLRSLGLGIGVWLE